MKTDIAYEISFSRPQVTTGPRDPSRPTIIVLAPSLLEALAKFLRVHGYYCDSEIHSVVEKGPLLNES
jgi:hypothetical protein